MHLRGVASGPAREPDAAPGRAVATIATIRGPVDPLRRDAENDAILVDGRVLQPAKFRQGRSVFGPEKRGALPRTRWSATWAAQS
jgi:hypothetical protein